ncbi:MAG: DNA-processing protein DprA [Beijerinckiaceae bacterium]|nr:DNA-processing protein DprA [Beijerinckiaceae bacterium]
MARVVLSVVAHTLTYMDEMRTAGVILAALELAPAAPSDVTAILLTATDRQVLLGGDDGGPDADAFSDSKQSSTREITPLARYLAEHIDQGRVEHWTKVVDRGISEGRYRPVPVTDPGYPRNLRGVWDAPPLLFCSLRPDGSFVPGSPPPIDTPHGVVPQSLDSAIHAGPSVAIVGSRETSDEVLKATEQVSTELAASGVTIVSGLAAGVDAAAHRGALAACGYTVAVMGTGIDLVFPEVNRKLATELTRVGTLVSQYAPPAPRTRTSFLLRNHVIAAVSDASLIMDGDERSGSRYEVEQAVDYNRPIFAWAPALGHRRWVQDLVQAGNARFVESAAEVSEHLARSRREGRR